MPTENDRPIPAAPCPTCRRPLEAWSDDIGQVVRCRGCGTRFRVAIAQVVAPMPDPDAADDPPEPAPSRDANPYDDGYGRFDEAVTPGKVFALATMHFVYCGLLNVCGVLSSVLMRVYPGVLPGPEAEPANRIYAHVLHGLMMAASVVAVLAGLSALRRRPSARGWSIAAMVVAGVLMLLSLGEIVLNMPVFTGRTNDTMGVMTGFLYQFAFWLGYIIPVWTLLASAGRDLDPPPS